MLLGTRPEEQDVGPKATDIMSGVFEVFVNLTQVFAGDPKYYSICIENVILRMGRVPNNH